MSSYIISEQAKRDIIEIWEYTVEKWSEKQAIRYYNDIIDKCEQIASNPEAIGRSYECVRPDLRGVISGRHIIFYRIIRQNKVRIVRILHSKMDVPKHF